MTISTTTNRVTYTGNGVTVAFSFPYAFFAKADLVVIETVIATGVQTVKTITTHYTISGSVDALGHYSSGGTVTAVTAPASTVTWTIYRDPAATQTTDLVENDPMPAESLEAALDYQTMLNQRTRDIAARSLRQPEGDSATIDPLPAKVDRASKYLGFDANGDPVATAGTTSAYVVTPFMETVLDDTTADAARTTLGAAASGAATASELTVATARLLGRTTALTGALEEISVGASLTLTGGSLSGTPASATQAGVTELATQAEVDAMTDTARVITPSHNKLVSAASQTTTSGTTKDFTDIPSGVRRITVQLDRVSTGGTSAYLLRVGAGSVATTGYVSSSEYVDSTSVNVTSSTAGFILYNDSAARSMIGTLVLTLLTGNTWQCAGMARRDTTLTSKCVGTITLAGTLDRFQFTTVSGDTFDAGNLGAFYER